MSESDLQFRFELDRLTSYSRDDILAEIKRVAAIVGRPVLTAVEFERHSKVSRSTVNRVFGGWREALDAAGIGHRYSGRRVTAKMRTQQARLMAAEEMVAELQRVAAEAGLSTLTMEAFSDLSTILNAAAVKSRFGSWRAGLEAAGLELSNLGRRYSEDDYFENLLTVWTHHRRAPFYAEMDRPPSVISAGAYENRWGTWSKARLAFLERVNADVRDAQTSIAHEGLPPRPRAASPRNLSVGMRYQVLVRDRFRCVICGNSPAVDLACRLHVDHIDPIAKGGETTAANLRSLCESCNLGKSDRLELHPRQAG